MNIFALEYFISSGNPCVRFLLEYIFQLAMKNCEINCNYHPKCNTFEARHVNIDFNVTPSPDRVCRCRSYILFPVLLSLPLLRGFLMANTCYLALLQVLAARNDVKLWCAQPHQPCLISSDPLEQQQQHQTTAGLS